MRGYSITDLKKLKETEISDSLVDSTTTKVKITKSLVTLLDVLRYNGEVSGENVVLGKHSVGIVSETGANLFDLEKGSRVYIEPYKECGKCYNCVNEEGGKCANLLQAGEDYNGYLSNFAVVNNESLFTLPDSVSDVEALFIDYIALAIKVVDKLNVQKGDYVAIVGANNFGIILAELLMYYSAVPVVITTDEEDYKIAKDSGIYYVLNGDDNWQKEVSSMTGGRMADKVVFVADCDVSASKAFNLASFNAQVAFTGVFYKNSPISFMQAIKKQLEIMCINNGYGNTASAINLLSNKAINLSKLKLDTAKYEEVPSVFKKSNAKLEKEEKLTETIIEYL